MVSELDQANSNRISVNAAEQDNYIRSVTVFQTNRAEVKRRVKLELKVSSRATRVNNTIVVLTYRVQRGQNHVDIEQLPSCINEDSIRVEGTGTAIIFDVVYHKNSSTDSAQLDDEAALTLHRQLHALKNERDVVQAEFGFLGSYGRGLGNKNISAEEVAQFLDMFRPRQVAVTKRLQELDIQVAEVQKEYELQTKAQTNPQVAKRRTKVTVTVLAETDGKAELMLTYSTFIPSMMKKQWRHITCSPIAVSHASWTPLYDVRASVGKSADASSTIALHYRASITQTTGENWPNVALTLSTASPQLGSTIPSLSPWRVGCPQPQSRSYRGRSRSHSPTRVINVGDVGRSRHHARYSRCRRSRSYSRSRSRSPQAMRVEAYSPPRYRRERSRSPSPMRWRDVQEVSADVLSAKFAIPGRSDIPSDEGNHKVVIQVLNLQANLEWICIPRQLESVFLKVS